MYRTWRIIFSILIGVSLSGSAHTRTMPYDSTGSGSSMYPRVATQITPNEQFDAHNVGKLVVAITNFGTFGTGFVQGYGTEPVKALWNEYPSGEYPINSNIQYHYSGAIWIGAIVGRDTLVSVGADGWFNDYGELFPDAGEAGAIISRSSLRSKPSYSADAVSEQDFICTYTDTFTDASIIGNTQYDPAGTHTPLHVAVRQSSYAWSYDYAEDFVLFDYEITNIGAFPIKQLYLALYVDGDVGSITNDEKYIDDICGFRRVVAAKRANACFDDDTVNIAWIADNDGDPKEGEGVWDPTSAVAVTGCRVLRSPNKDLKYTFNWWVSNGTATLDFGPRKAGTNDDPFRSFGSHLGTPTGDKNKYYIMSHPEFDYDQVFTAQSHIGEEYLPPPQVDLATDIADGYDTRYLLSFGPFDVAVGDTLPITVAYIAGDSFHTNPNNFQHNFIDKNDPQLYYDSLNFEDLGKNSVWASKIFDTWGKDTDGNGYYGEYCYKEVRDTFYIDTVCVDPPDCNTIGYDTVISYIADSTKNYYTGDGVPDFMGASPPAVPTIRVFPEFGKVTIRWNGQYSETKKDEFSDLLDFEGYRIYYGEDNRLTDFVLLCSYDIEDYKQFTYSLTSERWEQKTDGIPLTIDTLRKIYGSEFNPNDYYDEAHHITDSESNFVYFRPQDWNQSDLTNPRSIHRVYPDASKYNLNDTTDEGHLRYYEYEYTISNLQPSKPYYFAVTAFDFGSLREDIASMETSPLSNAVMEFPLPAAQEVEEGGLKAIVYPNPYRINAGYATIGYENRDRTKSVERARKINFANLPGKCTIRIFTLTGDLVKEINHTDGTSEASWDVISRNTQPAVTGIYVWQIESDMGSQIGKLVIIK